MKTTNMRALRAEMKKQHIDVYLVTATDPHGSEYICDHFKAVEWLCGCTSDNVKLLVTADAAWLWTDSRYHISAEKELAAAGLLANAEGTASDGESVDAAGMAGDGARGDAESTAVDGTRSEAEGDGGIVLMKDGLPGVPSYVNFIKERGWKPVSWQKVDLFDVIWEDRPRLPANPIRVLSDELAGVAFSEKLAWLRDVYFGQPAATLDQHVDAKKTGRDAGLEKHVESDASDVAVVPLREHGPGDGAASLHHVQPPLILKKLDDIMWLCNLRGNDIPYNPVALSYAEIGVDYVNLYLQPEALSDEVQAYLSENGVSVRDYADFDEASILAGGAGSANAAAGVATSVMGGTSVAGSMASAVGAISAAGSAGDRALKKQVDEAKRRALAALALRKSRKNPVEIQNIRKYYLLDSVAVCRFIYQMKRYAKGTVPGGAALETLTEYDAAQMINGDRAKIPGFLDLSFETIAAYGANAAMAHYAPTADAAAPILREGFLLVDSGGQYMGATTDVTRTIAMGPLTDEQKRDFTLVAAANLRLLFAVFREGTNGAQLDTIAREPLWEHGLDFGHGTGHGIGYILNVHEGPQRIAPVPKVFTESMIPVMGKDGMGDAYCDAKALAGESTTVGSQPEAVGGHTLVYDHILGEGETRSINGVDIPMQVGMITSDEPGIYWKDRYGIRTESIVLCVPFADTEAGSFLQFEPLTFVPIDRDAVDMEYLSADDAALLDRYHAMVYEKVAPYLSEEECAWLADATRPLG